MKNSLMHSFLSTFLICLLSLSSVSSFANEDPEKAFRSCQGLSGSAKVECANKAAEEDISKKHNQGANAGNAFKIAIATITSAVTVYIFMRYKKELKEKHGCAKASVTIMGASAIASMVAEMWSRIQYAKRMAELKENFQVDMANYKLDSPSIQMKAYDHMIEIENVRISSEKIRKTGYTVAALGYATTGVMAGVEIATQVTTGKPPAFCKVSSEFIKQRKDFRKQRKSNINSNSLRDIAGISFKPELNEDLINEIESGRLQIDKQDPYYVNIKIVVKKIVNQIFDQIVSSAIAQDRGKVLDLNKTMLSDSSRGFGIKNGQDFQRLFPKGEYETVLDYLCQSDKSNSQYRNQSLSNDMVIKKRIYDKKLATSLGLKGNSGAGRMFNKDTVKRYQSKYCKKYHEFMKVKETFTNKIEVQKIQNTAKVKDVGTNIEEHFKNQKIIETRFETLQTGADKISDGVLRFIGVAWKRLAYSAVMGTFSNVLRIQAKKNIETSEKRINALEGLKEKIKERYSLDGNKFELVKRRKALKNNGSGEWGSSSRSSYTDIKTCMARNGKPDLKCKCVRTKSCLKLVPGFKFKQPGLASINMAGGYINSATRGGLSNGSANLDKMNDLRNAFNRKTRKIIGKIAKKNPKLAKKIKDLERKIPLGLERSFAGLKDPIMANAAQNSSANTSIALPANLKLSKKLKEEMKKDIDTVKFIESKGLAKKKSDGMNGLDFDFDTEGNISSVDHEKLEEVMQKDFDYKENDISKNKEQDIFKILSNRYMQSGLKRLFE